MILSLRRRSTGAQAVVLLLAALPLIACSHGPTARSDLSFEPKVGLPAFAAASGPRVAIDESHCNYHTAGGRYEPFAELLRRDGFVVEPLTSGFTATTLAGFDVLVIANALACGDTWKLPTPPAFRSAEIAAVEEWVDAGGALLLIADHMPFPGAAEELARAFGFAFINGYAQPDDRAGTIRFETAAGTLAEHEITSGRSAAERVDAIVTFTGQGFRSLRPEVQPLLTLPEKTRIRLPREAAKFTKTTPSFSAEGLLQGAVLLHGKGRVAVFGEAAMFSAQEFVRDQEVDRMGMNAPGAEQNAQFVLNLMHWLTGVGSR